MQKVVLAYSGGLDTSVILKWLAEQNYEVIAYVADVGQNENLAEAEAKAYATGASKVYVEDLKAALVTDYIFPAIQANAIYEGRYLLGTSLARPLIAKRQIEIAHAEGAQAVSHGSTGKGNDQLRFEIAYQALDPEITIIAPWKDKTFLSHFKGRPELLAYAGQHNIEVKASRSKPYSEDANLIHTSHEAGVLEDPAHVAHESVYSVTVSPKEAPDQETLLAIQFKDGKPVKVMDETNGAEIDTPYELFVYLNQVGAANGIGRVDMVENRFVGIKSRGIYESPGMTILRAAHMDIEGMAMDREVMRLRDMLTPKFSELVYNGFWFSPEMDFLMAAIKKSQELIDGTVKLALYKGNVMVQGRTSPSSLYNQDLSSMDIEGGFDQSDSAGFINIHALRLKAHHAIVQQRQGSEYAGV